MSWKKKVLRFFGTNEVQVKWKWQRLQERLRAPKDDAAPVKPKNIYRHCTACRTLVSDDERTCPSCGEALPSLAAVKLNKFLTSVLPDEQPTTKLLLALLFGLYVAMTLDAFQATGSENLFGALLHPPIDVMWRWGAHIREEFEPWRLVMSNFIHFGILHLGFNAYALRLAGPMVERAYGSALAFVLFVVTGVGAMAASNLIGPFGIVAGASGALMGWIGLAGVAGHREGTSYGYAIRNLMIRWTAFVMVFGLIASMTGFMAVDNYAHAGGLLFGAAFGAVLPIQRGGRWGTTTTRRLVALGVVAALAVIGFGVYGMVRTRHDDQAFTDCVSNLKAKKFEQAIPACERAREGNKDFAGAYHNLAQAYLNASRGDDAVKVCKAAVARLGRAEIEKVSVLCTRLSE